MKTITIQIGNSDNKLPQNRWSVFISRIFDDILIWTADIQFSGGSSVEKSWQNYCWVINVEDEYIEKLKESISMRGSSYEQDSIAWTEGETQFI